MSQMQRKQSFVATFVGKKNANLCVLSQSDYENLVNEVIVARASVKKDQKQRRRLKRFQVIQESGRNSLIRPGTVHNPVYYLVIEEIYDVINTAHASCGHSGRDRIRYALKDRYANITYDMIIEYLKDCEACQAKKSIPSAGIVVKPMVQNGYLERAQVDLIDVQARPDGQFKWILVFQDHFTKRVSLRAIRQKSGLDVANALIDIFAETGAPRLLHSDNGREFKNRNVRALKTLFPAMDFVHGRSRYPASQGSVEKANHDIERMLTCWLHENKCPNWVLGMQTFYLLIEQH